MPKYYPEMRPTAAHEEALFVTWTATMFDDQHNPVGFDTVEEADAEVLASKKLDNEYGYSQEYRIRVGA